MKKIIALYIGPLLISLTASAYLCFPNHNDNNIDTQMLGARIKLNPQRHVKKIVAVVYKDNIWPYGAAIDQKDVDMISSMLATAKYYTSYKYKPLSHNLQERNLRILYDDGVVEYVNVLYRVDENKSLCSYGGSFFDSDKIRNILRPYQDISFIEKNANYESKKFNAGEKPAHKTDKRIIYFKDNLDLLKIYFYEFSELRKTVSPPSEGQDETGNATP